MKTRKWLLKKSENSEKSEFSSWPSLQSHQGFNQGGSMVYSGKNGGILIKEAAGLLRSFGPFRSPNFTVCFKCSEKKYVVISSILIKESSPSN